MKLCYIIVESYNDGTLRRITDKLFERPIDAEYFIETQLKSNCTNTISMPRTLLVLQCYRYKV